MINIQDAKKLVYIWLTIVWKFRSKRLLRQKNPKEKRIIMCKVNAIKQLIKMNSSKTWLRPTSKTHIKKY